MGRGPGPPRASRNARFVVTLEGEPDGRSAALSDRYDAIVIGSGIGGLTCASLLARLRGKRVLVLERHYRLGGFMQGFRRGAFSWDIGLHYVGQMSPGDPLRALMDFITAGSVRWLPISSPFERYRFPELTFAQPAGREAYEEALKACWPNEADAIARYFVRVGEAYEWFADRFLARAGADIDRPRAGAGNRHRDLALATTARVFDDCGLASPRLRSVLAAQWGDYGLPPASSAFVAHAIVVAHYLEGGFVPEGGASAIPASVKRVIGAAGGACLTSHTVEEILVREGRVHGVRVRTPGRAAETHEVTAPLIISDAGMRVTCEQLLHNHPEAIAPLRGRLGRMSEGTSVVQLFLALDRSPEALGFDGANDWMFDSLDHDDVYAHRNELATGHASTAYLSFPSLRLGSAETHTAEIIAPLDHAAWAPWLDTNWKRRGDAYNDAKQRVTDALLRFVDRFHPGFSGLVQYAELGTPLSVQHFTAQPAGAVYGLPSSPERYAVMCDAGVATPIEGLLLTGSDVATHGIVGAMLGGAVTAGHVLGAGGFQRIMAAVRAAR